MNKQREATVRVVLTGPARVSSDGHKLHEAESIFTVPSGMTGELHGIEVTALSGNRIETTGYVVWDAAFITSTELEADEDKPVCQVGHQLRRIVVWWEDTGVPLSTLQIVGVVEHKNAKDVE